jgi:hypothetical protein
MERQRKPTVNTKTGEEAIINLKPSLMPYIGRDRIGNDLFYSVPSKTQSGLNVINNL